jgi:hypothetical protein
MDAKRARALSILLQLPNVSNNKKRQIRDELNKMRMNLPKNLKMEILKHLKGKHKRVYARVHGLELQRKPKTKSFKIFYNNTKRFDNIPVVYKNPNWRYFYIMERGNVSEDVHYPIFYNRINNIPNNYLGLHYSNERLAPWNPYYIHPKTGKKRYANSYSPRMIRARAASPDTNLMTRNLQRNTWNNYIRRTHSKDKNQK